jgi:hypothetical protein
MFNSEFFPTPAEIGEKMMSKLKDKNAVKHILEPNAGKGDLALVASGDHAYAGQHRPRQVDCIEMEPELIAILQSKEFQVVGFDWLAYDGVCYYDAIIMNPPFSNGDQHLLKAWDFMIDGEIVCLLNMETLRNPHSKNRRRILDLIKAHGSIESLGKCFKGSERSTDVEVALVYLCKESEDDSFDLWGDLTPEKDFDLDEAQANMPAVQDKLGNKVRFYEQSVKHMIGAMKEMRRATAMMEAAGISISEEDIANVMKNGRKNLNAGTASYTKLAKAAAWKHIFYQMDFDKWLDKKQKEEFLVDAAKNESIPFTVDNIKATLENVFLMREDLFKKSVWNVFQELTKYDAKCEHHSEGWKTNNSWKVNRKAIFPFGAEYRDWGSGGYFSRNYGGRSIDICDDLDRVACVLMGRKFPSRNDSDEEKEDPNRVVTIGAALDQAWADLPRLQKGDKFDNTAESTFFHLRFFKKGTVHLQFKDDLLWAAFNKAAAEGANAIGYDLNADLAA